MLAGNTRESKAGRKSAEQRGIRQADIARRERLTRARVTQIMSLLDLPADLKAMLLGADTEVEGGSIRRALREVG